MAEWLSDKQEQKLRLVAWPSPQDYNEAIQNPSTCFQDPDLLGLAPQITALGLPKPATGNFATVYHLTGGAKEFAVRCFLHPMKDEKDRYEALSKWLKEHALPNCVSFEFVETGIKVYDEWRPIVKMEWASGVGLVDHVRQIKAESERLERLAENFKNMVLTMSELGIAHGDLQHGNMIVDGDQIKLVDYDAVFVPELAGFASNELGHPNYQHPQRTADFFNDTLDRFSAWVIYASLKILAIDPSLWQVLNAGDECLLFRKADYQDPENSRAFYVLETHPDLRVQRWSKLVRWMLSLPVEQLPNLDAAVIEPGDLPAVAAPPVSFDRWQEWDASEVSAPAAFSSNAPAKVVLAAAQPPQLLAIAPRKSARMAANSIGLFLLLTFLMVAGIYYWAVISWRSKENEQRQPAVVTAAPSPDKDAEGSAPAPSVVAYQEGVEAMKGTPLWSLEIEKFQLARALDITDHGLSDDQRANCNHEIGHWQYQSDLADHGVAAFQSAYDLYAKTGRKCTNILDDVAHGLSIESKYMAATDKEFEALRVGLSEGGTDSQTKEFSGFGELQQIKVLMPFCLKPNPKEAVQIYTKICRYLELGPFNNPSLQNTALNRLNQFVRMLLDEASNQLDKNQIEIAQALTELSGKAIDNNAELKNLSVVRNSLLQKIANARKSGAH